jgi:hypothetical protein
MLKMQEKVLIFSTQILTNKIKLSLNGYHYVHKGTIFDFILNEFSLHNSTDLTVA